MIKKKVVKQPAVSVSGFSGERYEGDSFHQVVEAMRAGTFGGDDSAGVRGYMKQISKRIFEWNGATVRTDKAENFLHDLQQAGVLRIERPLK